MNQQAADLRRPGQIIRRNGPLIGVMAVLGLLAGAIFAALCPPLHTGQVTAAVTPEPICLYCQGTMIAPGAFNVDPVTATGTGRTATQAAAAAIAAARSEITQIQSANAQAKHWTWQIVQPGTIAPATVPPRVMLTDSLLVGAAGGALLGIIAALASSWTSGEAPTVARALRATG